MQSMMERTAAPGILSFEERGEIPAPISEVYRRLTDFSRFPEFMNNVKEVRPLGGGRYHWIARVLGQKQEWDSEVTDQQENERLSWRNLSGPTNIGTIWLQPLPNNRTAVQLRMEYTPPGGVVGQKLEQLTESHRKQVKQSLENLRRAFTGERQYGFEGATPGLAPVAGAFTIPTVAGVIGGMTAYALVRNRRRRAAAVLLGRQGARVEPSGAIGGWLLALSTIGSMLVAARYRQVGEHGKAVSIGQYAPSLLGLGILLRMLGHRALKPSLPGTVASWAFTSAALGSTVSSVIAHGRGKHHDGLFIGHWAPTFLAAAILSRLFNRP
jgi:uncharacterized membrane protein